MTDDEPEDTREHGVEFGGLLEELAEEDYPLSQDELLSTYGDRELELGEETVTIEELLGPMNQETYNDYDTVKQAIYNMVGDEAVGRKHYSDRSSAPDEGGDESF